MTGDTESIWSPAASGVPRGPYWVQYGLTYLSVTWMKRQSASSASLLMIENGEEWLKRTSEQKDLRWMTGHPRASSVYMWPRRPIVSWGAFLFLWHLSCDREKCSSCFRESLIQTQEHWVAKERKKEQTNNKKNKTKQKKTKKREKRNNREMKR